ncbi:MAG TPA: phage tail protein, partial [Candidatus Limnocylindrales bacterium]|nr:phage tail protein [Candidatus Limnocylindrales bacterium]
LIYDAAPGSSEYPAANYPAWDPSILYNIGDIISYNGLVYDCDQQNTGITPGQTADETGGILYWSQLGSYQPWDINGTYGPGDVVIYNGVLYVNIQSTNPPAHTPNNDHYWQTLNTYYGVPAIYPGNQTQVPDSVIQANEGIDNTPAFRGNIHARFQRFPLANFGNRIPSMRAELALGKGNGPVIWQSAELDGVGPGAALLNLNLPIETTDFLVACSRFRPNGGGPTTLPDDGVNTWQMFVGGDNRAIFYCANPVATPTLSISFWDNSGIGGITYDFGASVAVIRGASSYTKSSATGPILPLSVTNGLTSLTLSTGDILWLAALFTFSDENRETLDVGVLCFDPPGTYGTDLSAQAFEALNKSAQTDIVVSGIPSNRLGQVVLDICQRAGLDSTMVDVSLLTAGNVFPNDIVQGYAITRPTSAAEIIKQLMDLYFFDGCESDGKLKFVPRGLDPVITIPEEDLGLLEDDAKVKPEQIEQSQDLPKRVTIYYNDIGMDFQQGKQEKQRSSRIIKTRQQETIEAAVTMDPSFARQVAEKTLFLKWLERNSYITNLWRAIYALIDPTDVVRFVYGGATFQMRLTECLLGQGLATKLSGLGDNAKNYLSIVAGSNGSGFKPQPLILAAPTLLFLFDTPLLRDIDANPGGTGYYAGMSSTIVTWTSGTFFRSTDDANYAQVDTSSDAVPFGYAQSALGDPRSPWTWDRANSLTVKMSLGQLTGASDLNVLDGWNAALLGNTSTGVFEVIQFQSAVLNVDGTYTISKLLRGRRGTEGAIGTHGIGDLFVLLPTGMRHEKDPLSVVNQLRYYKAASSGQDISSLASQQFTNSGNDLRPYAATSVKGTRDISGNLTATWIRRTRIGGDWLDGIGTVPVSEDAESYQVDVMNGSTVVRTISGLSSPTASYSAADQTTDFGSPQASVSLRIYQMSAQIGRGFRKAVTV